MSAPTKYPVTVVYCGNCGLPPEFCEFGVNFEKCKPWLIANVPHLYPQLASPAASRESTATAGVSGDAALSGAGASDGAKADTAGVDAVAADVGKLVVDGGGEEDDSGDEKKKKSKRGGGVIRGGPKKKAAPVGGAVIITKKDRGRRKYVTTISGLDAFDVKLKEAASALGKKFGAGASVSKSAEGKPEIDVQGDVVYDLPELLTSLFGIPEEAIICRD